MRIRSSAFSHQNEIPTLYTCQGKDISVPLAWDELPEKAQSLVLIVDDPDAPDPQAPKMTWIHWILYNISPSVHGLEEGSDSTHLPRGVLRGENSWKRNDYGGPCPPIGRHRYFHKLFALDIMLPDLKYPTVDKLYATMEGHVLAKAELIGTYQKS